MTAAMVDYTPASSAVSADDLAALQAAMPTPASTVPGTETPSGSAGTGSTYRRGDAIQPRITRSKTLTLDASGLATWNWVADGQPVLPGANFQPVPVPIYTGAGTPSCWATAVSNSSVSVKCVVSSISLVSVLGVSVGSGPVAANGMQVGVTVLPAS